jgi:acetoacetyl-CoA synthetase
MDGFTGWMMLNALYAGLGSGATLVLFDGSPLWHPPLLWQMADEVGVTIFGTVGILLH